MKSIAVALGTVAVTLASSSVACDCATRGPLWESKQPHVFLAEVTSIESKVARFKVQETYRGAPERLGRLHTVWGSDCEVSLTSGVKYLVFANGDGLVTQCDGTRPFNPATDGELLQRLRQLRIKP